MPKFTLKFLICCIILLANCKQTNNSSNEKQAETTIAAKVFEKKPELLLDRLQEIQSLEDLEKLFGASNLQKEAVYKGADTTQYAASIIYPNQENEAWVIWAKNQKYTKAESVVVGQGNWYTSSGLHLGIDLKTVNELNGKMFSISGFDWEYAGTLVGWEGGTLDKQNISCRFAKPQNLPISNEELQQINGSTEFYTNHEILKKLNPVIDQLVLKIN